MKRPTKKVTYYESGQIWSEYWYIDGKRHRTDGPAVVWYYESSGQVESEYWWVDGKWHRTDGPARIYYYESSGQVKSEHWLVNDKWYSKEEWDQHPKVMDHKFDLMIDEELSR